MKLLINSLIGLDLAFMRQVWKSGPSRTKYFLLQRHELLNILLHTLLV